MKMRRQLDAIMNRFREAEKKVEKPAKMPKLSMKLKWK
jgi:hypothetical protein